MGIELRPQRAHHQTGAGDGRSGTAWFRGQSAAPPTAGHVALMVNSLAVDPAETMLQDLPGGTPSTHFKE
ncbi:MAG: hypothetical protein ABWY04_07610 [Arthrobacter sp.]